MARQLLDTSTTTWGDLFSNGRRFAVPTFQRDYSWNEDQWLDLWRDVEALGAGDGSHYMGTIVLKAVSDGSFEVIDGQQRLATLSILALAVIEAIQSLARRGIDTEANEERAKLLRDRLISSKHPASLKFESRLRLNENDDGFYQAYLVQLTQPSNPARLLGSEQRLWQAFEFFKTAVFARFQDETQGARLAAFLSETVASGITFIQIQVESDLSAYTVFETLNARGLQLTATDLLKNYLFSLVASSPGDLELIRAQWRRLVAQVSMEDFPDFAYHYLVSLGRETRKQRLFADMRALIQSREEVFQRVEDMLGASDWYVALSDPNDQLWTAYPDARPFVRELSLFRVDQYKPLILAARERIVEGRVDAASLLRVCSVLSLRATIIGHKNTADVLRAYRAGVEAVRQGARSAKAVFEALRSLYPSDEEFRASFEAASFGSAGPRRKLVKYLLSQIEGTYGATAPDFESDSASIEHVLPENPSNQWGFGHDAEARERFVYRLGNLTLLEPPLNREAGSSGFEDKRAVYRRSKYAMTRAIDQDEWTAESIRSRQADMAKRAVQSWRLDF